MPMGLSLKQLSASNVAGSLQGLQWLLPFVAPAGPWYCQTVPTVTTTATLAGSPSTTYNVTLRFQGVAECTNYSGGSGPITTTLTSASNGQLLSSGTLNVVSTSGFPTAPATIKVHTGNNQYPSGVVPIMYTGATGNTFTGVTLNPPLSTTISSGSNGLSLPQSTINVAGPLNNVWPGTGTLQVMTNAGYQSVTYTNITNTSFTGCSGGTGTMVTGNAVNLDAVLATGNTVDGFFHTAGTPANSQWNIYSLTISNPSQTYYLNFGPDMANITWYLDYTVTIPINGGATVTLIANPDDSGPYEIYNSNTNAQYLHTPISIAGVSNPAQPFNGQFINMSVIAVS